MPAESSKRRRLDRSSSHLATSPSRVPLSNLIKAATEEDKTKWTGWCEIESDPGFFNVMLKQFGVEGVKVQEVVSLDADILTSLPRPVYGLIFLFKWKDDDAIKQGGKCPDSVWFANQTVRNACATVALLNIVNNIPNIELGQHLKQFRQFTEDFHPALRGDAISNFEFVKQIHNKFARKMDMLSDDLHMKDEISASKNDRGKAFRRKEEASEMAFHFNAFVPIDGTLWKLDGLERQPQTLGTIGKNDWLSQVKPDLEARMSEYEDGQIEFAILSLVKEPLISLVLSLSENIRTLQGVTEALNTIDPGWRGFVATESIGGGDVEENILLGPDPGYCVDQKRLDNTRISSKSQKKLVSVSIGTLLPFWQEVVKAQSLLRALIKQEQESSQVDEEKAARRRHDYGSTIHTWLRYHAQKLLVREIITSTGVRV